jgi:cytochrome c oxidase subunit II
MKVRKACARSAGSFIGLLALTTLAGCSGGRHPMNTLQDKSDLASWITSLFVQITVWDTIVLATVVVGLFLAIFVFSTRVGGPGEPSTVTGDLRLELAWTIGPALILLFITIPTVRLIVRSQPYKWPKNALPIRVIGHQWWWEFKYPTLGIDTANEMHIPADKLIHLELVSADVIHSFWVPALGGKRDLIPGQVNEITLVAKVPGKYYGQCAQFCGESHANMRMRVFVDTEEGFKNWVAHQRTPPVQPKGQEAMAGEKIFRNAPCAICHSIKGISGFSKQYKYGFRGPDLTHFASRTTFAGSIMKNTPKNLAVWLENPGKVKPGAKMPNLGLHGKQLTDLVAYLESLQ